MLIRQYLFFTLAAMAVWLTAALPVLCSRLLSTLSVSPAPMSLLPLQYLLFSHLPLRLSLSNSLSFVSVLFCVLGLFALLYAKKLL